MPRAAFYARYGTVEQRTTSIEDQVRRASEKAENLGVEIADTSPHQSKKEELCQEPQFTPDTQPQNSEQHQSKTKSGAPAKKQKA